MEELKQARKAVNGDKVVPISQDGLQGDLKAQHRAKDRSPRSDDRGFFCGMRGGDAVYWGGIRKKRSEGIDKY